MEAPALLTRCNPSEWGADANRQTTLGLSQTLALGSAQVFSQDRHVSGVVSASRSRTETAIKRHGYGPAILETRSLDHIHQAQRHSLVVETAPQPS